MFKLTAKALTRAEQDSLIADKRQWIIQNSVPQRIILFGSAARREMTDASDIDLILIFVDLATKDAAKRSLFESRPKDDWPHDLLFYSLAEFNESVRKGGGATWLAQTEGEILFQADFEEEKL